MALTRIIGDIHGKWYHYQLLTRPIEHRSVQVGDFGIGFNSDAWEDRVNDFHASGQHRFIRGNHDKPSTCKAAMVGYIADGTVENGVMYLGGAWSIDNPVAPPEWHRRTPGLDWWDDEECSDEQFQQMLETYKAVKPRVMITHDCPTLTAYRMFIKKGKSLAHKTLYLSRTGEALQTMFEIHQPEHWFFGHWHTTTQMDIDGTSFQCIGELDFIDVEM